MEYFFDMGSKITAENLRRLRRRLAELGADEKLRIRLEAADAHQAAGLTSLLVENGYTYQPHGSHSGEDYYLLVRRLH
ncbi:MAG: hypothetical protein ACOX18_05990 [Bacillota bacterium]|jgi:glycine cleavage system regulatory protein